MLPEEVADWSFKQLVQWASWEVAQGLIAGQKLESVMFAVIQTATYWQKEKRS